MKISLLMDNPHSWYAPHALKLVAELAKEHEVVLVHSDVEILVGDLAFFLSCEKIIKADIRARNTHSLVVHSSALPQGKGWSPLTWQIIAGKNIVTNTLFEAVDRVDAGVVYLQNEMHFEGHELIDELRQAQGEATMALVKKFVASYPNISGRKQSGAESFYPRRTSKDSELDVDKTLAEQFNLLRVVDNERYPAFFHFQGHRYVIKITKDDT